MKEKSNESPFIRLISNTRAMFYIFADEVKKIFKDRGVVIIVILAPLVYPLLYCSLYFNETIVDMPVGVVINSKSNISSKIIRDLDATCDLKVINEFSNLKEAEQWYKKGKIHGIIFIPSDFNRKIIKGEQANISVYSDMSSFLYYRAMILGTNYVILHNSKDIELKRLNAQGITGEQASQISDPAPYKSTILYNDGMGFASFLMPAILILIIHQTLFFGIGMAAGTAREENRLHEFVSSSIHRGRVFRVIFGKSMAYFMIYLLWTIYIVGVIPEIFNLPHIGNPATLLEFLVPFLLSTIFFSMTVSAFNPSRESQMALFLFFSLILLFLSGISWPKSNINGFWKALSYIFPSTFGIQGYIKINSMGASIHEIGWEQKGLWIQTAFYFALTTIVYFWQIKQSDKS